VVLPDHLLEAKRLRIRRDESGHLAAEASLFEIVADYERRKIIEQLEASDWSQTAAEGFTGATVDAEPEDQAVEY
jgi:hypothetical protein